METIEDVKAWLKRHVWGIVARAHLHHDADAIHICALWLAYSMGDAAQEGVLIDACNRYEAFNRTPDTRK